MPPIGEKNLRECRWEPAVELTIPDDWPSGVYLGRLSTTTDARLVQVLAGMVLAVQQESDRDD